MISQPLTTDVAQKQVMVTVCCNYAQTIVYFEQALVSDIRRDIVQHSNPLNQASGPKYSI